MYDAQDGPSLVGQLQTLIAMVATAGGQVYVHINKAREQGVALQINHLDAFRDIG